MNADELFIASSSSKYECVPVIDSSTADSPQFNTAIPTNLVIKGKDAKLSCHLKALNITSASFSELTAISNASGLSYVFSESGYLTSVSFPELTTISGNYALNSAFYDCAKLTSVSFPKLTTISGNYALNRTFYNCTNLTSVSFPELTTISDSYALNSTFYNCANLTSVSFPKLTTVTYPKNAFCQAGSSTLTIHLPKALSNLGITNDNRSNSSSYCRFVYDL